jgi:hypothetical protein
MAAMIGPYRNHMVNAKARRANLTLTLINIELPNRILGACPARLYRPLTIRAE